MSIWKKFGVFVAVQERHLPVSHVMITRLHVGCFALIHDLFVAARR